MSLFEDVETVQVLVHNFTEAVRFYTDMLGLETVDVDAEDQFCLLRVGSGQTMLSLWGRTPAGDDRPLAVRGRVYPILRVGDLDATVDELARRWVVIAVPPRPGHGPFQTPSCSMARATTSSSSSGSPRRARSSVARPAAA